MSPWDSKKCEIGEYVLGGHLKIQKELISFLGLISCNIRIVNQKVFIQ